MRTDHQLKVYSKINIIFNLYVGTSKLFCGNFTKRQPQYHATRPEKVVSEDINGNVLIALINYLFISSI